MSYQEVLKLIKILNLLIKRTIRLIVKSLHLKTALRGEQNKNMMQFENIQIRFSILTIQIELNAEDQQWISHFVIYDHSKDETVEGEIIEHDFSTLENNKELMLNEINYLLGLNKVTPETNILFHEIYSNGKIIPEESELETLSTNQSYIWYTNRLGFESSIKIEKCIVNLHDLFSLETLDNAFTDNSRNKNLGLDYATKIKNFGVYYIVFINFLLKL